jgi:glycosyltransferase involved in cell wall biosynthesis
MKILLVNHYAVPTKYYPLSRPFLFAKNLINMGHDVTIVAASSIHNSDCDNLIKDKRQYLELIDDGVPYFLIKCCSYKGNGFRRIWNILEFASKLPKALKKFSNVDAIIATSFDPFSCYKSIVFSNKHKIKVVAEIADLWPETLVDYCKISRINPIVLFLRHLEKRIYTRSNAIVFTMEGAYDYIVQQKWEGDIPKSKTYYINNGIDNDQFEFNRNNFQINDEDLNDKNTFKVVYTGSIRKVNNLGLVLDIAKYITLSNIKFLIWGNGDELNVLKERVRKEQINNVVFKGSVEKKYIPYILSKADLNYAHNGQSKMFFYGISFNKIFDYLAAGKPILCDFDSKYNPVIQYGAGIEINPNDPKLIASQIEKISRMEKKEYNSFSKNALMAAKDFDFKSLTNKLLFVINSIKEG